MAEGLVLKICSKEEMYIISGYPCNGFVSANKSETKYAMQHQRNTYRDTYPPGLGLIWRWNAKINKMGGGGGQLCHFNLIIHKNL